MASLCNDRNGNRRILFVDASGNRKCIRLGKTDKRTAEVVLRHVENLLGSRLAGVAPPKDTATWLGGISDELRRKLAKCGLIDWQAEGTITLGQHLEQYLKRRFDAKPSTHVHWRQAQQQLLRFFGPDRPLDTITPGDAADFARWLRSPEARVMRYGEATPGVSLSANTVGKRLQDAKQFFRDAVDRGLIDANPFEKIVGRCGCNRQRDYFVDQDTALRVLEACPDAEWRAMFSLARWGALRVPSELLVLKWTDINWAAGRFTVRSPKTAHHAGHEGRIVPLFPEVARALSELWEVTPPGAVYVINRYRHSSVNLRTQLQRIIERAGVKPWPKLWQNLRATRATELAQQFPRHVAAAWCGHSVVIADRHYWQVTEADFARAIGGQSEQTDSGANCGAAGAQNAAQHPSATIGKIAKLAPQPSADFTVMPIAAERNCLLHKGLMGDDRLELVSATIDSTTTCEKPQTAGGAKSGAVGAENGLKALAKQLLKLPDEDRQRLLRLLQTDGQ